MLQWQDELRNLLDLPSAVWTGKAWLDENGIEHPAPGPEGIKKCPRRFGIVSYGLVKSKSEAVEFLKEMRFECIIVDEVHNARRTKLSAGIRRGSPKQLAGVPARDRAAHEKFFDGHGHAGADQSD